MVLHGTGGSSAAAIDAALRMTGAEYRVVVLIHLGERFPASGLLPVEPAARAMPGCMLGARLSRRTSW